MKILIASQQFRPARNGIATSASSVADRLVKYGHEVVVYTDVIKKGCKVQDEPGMSVQRFQAAGLGRLGNPYRGEIHRYQQRLIQSRADAFIFVCWENWFLDNALPVFGELAGKKIIASHGTSALWRPPGLKGALRRLLYLPHLSRYHDGLEKTDALVVLTDMLQRERFYDNILVKERPHVRLATIPNGHSAMPVGSLGEFRREYGLEGKGIALCVGNYTWSKNQVELMKLFYAAKLKDWTLVLIGSSTSSYYKRLKSQARRYALQGVEILVLSNVDREIASAYRDADLFVTTSITEAQPLVLLDAMGVGLPFIAYDVGCIAELPGGIAVKGPMQFVEGLKSLAASPLERRRLGQLGKLSASTYYCWDLVGAHYAQLLTSLTGLA